MTWKIEFDEDCEKTFSKLDIQSQNLILNYLFKKVMKLEHPKDLGKPLRNKLKGYWCYRVNKFRLICKIDENELLVLVLEVAKRDVVYND